MIQWWWLLVGIYLAFNIGSLTGEACTQWRRGLRWPDTTFRCTWWELGLAILACALVPITPVHALARGRRNRRVARARQCSRA